MSSQTTAAPAHRRIAFLDVLRSLAILLVMAHHYRHMPGTPAWAKWFGLRGYLGVDVFFVLSGWLIGGQLLKEYKKTGSIRLGRFWARRWLRTLPLYYVVLAFHLYTHPKAVSHTLEMVFFLQNYTAPHAWLLSWSLCIEEHFYMVLPLLLLLGGLVGKRSRTALIVVFVGLVLASPVLRWMAMEQVAKARYNSFLGDYYVPTHLRFDGLIVGVGLAYLKVYWSGFQAWVKRFATPLLVVGFAFFAAALFPDWTGHTAKGVERQTVFNYVLQFPLVYVAVAAWIASGVGFVERGRQPGIPGATWLAEHAYALYLIHWMASHWIARSVSFPSSFFLAGALSCALAALLRQLIELPGLKLRDRWTP